MKSYRMSHVMGNRKEGNKQKGYFAADECITTSKPLAFFAGLGKPQPRTDRAKAR